MKWSEIGALIAVVVLGLGIPIGIVLLRRDPPPAVAPPVDPPAAVEDEELSAAISEVAKRLDAQEQNVARLEDPALPAKDQLPAAEAALAGMKQADEAMKRLLRAAKARSEAGGLGQFRPRLEEVTQRATRLTDRLQAATAKLRKAGGKEG
jgi:hypothetical protein